MSRLADERDPDPYDDGLESTLLRAELAEIESAEASANRVDAAMLQPTHMPRRRSSGRRRSRTSRKKGTGVPGRPTIGDEARTERGSVRMTPATAKTVERLGGNLSMLVELLVQTVESGDAALLLELHISHRDAI